MLRDDVVGASDGRMPSVCQLREVDGARNVIDEQHIVDEPAIEIKIAAEQQIANSNGAT